MTNDLAPFGDDAVRFALPTMAKAASAADLLAALRAVASVTDVVLTEEHGVALLAKGAGPEASAAIARALAAAATTAPTTAARSPAVHVIRAIYDGEDLDAVAGAIGRTREGTIALHAERDYHVAMLGFLPGFAYLRDVDPALRLPRRPPRTKVPRGSIGVAASYTGIYPYASPGGWNLLGRALDFEPFGATAATLSIGDVVRFLPSPNADPGAPTPAPARQPAPPPPAGPRPRPYLEVTRTQGIALVVDRGRPGRMHEGVPPGGPLVRALAAGANALAGNEEGAATIEVVGKLDVVARGGRVVVASERRVVLADGETFTVASGSLRTAYLAVEGGVDAPLVLGGRGALLVAGIGGPLRRGDRIRPGNGGGVAVTTGRDRLSVDAAIAVMPGPDEVPGFSFATLGEVRVSPASDRTGVRLAGWSPPEAHVTRLSRASAPMVCGAIELTPSGLIVLGPDHPTTGGYPVVGVVRRRSLDSLFARQPAAAVRFTVDP